MRTLFFVAVTLLALALDAQPAPKHKGPGFAKKGPGPEAMERFSRLTPAERREALDKLPPERRQMMERRLEKWANTPPDERKRLAGSYAQFQGMAPEKQQAVRQLFRQFSQTFPPERRPQAQNAIRQLKKAEPEERSKILASPRFQEMFNDEERKLIDQMANELPDRP